MSAETEELVRICEGLPVEKRIEVADFARFLAARQDEERWERLIGYQHQRPKLNVFLRESNDERETLMKMNRL
ncbi:MAG: hypothetical protein JWQ04_789 [Pedosphaera sp.]|nr:hypothetical protein [Pedosphaera sp.]